MRSEWRAWVLMIFVVLLMAGASWLVVSFINNSHSQADANVCFTKTPLYTLMCNITGNLYNTSNAIYPGINKTLYEEVSKNPSYNCTIIDTQQQLNLNECNKIISAENQTIYKIQTSVYNH